MFWDMGYVSRVSNFIYDTHFSSIIFPATDNGTPPLYSLYLATLWIVFGKSLLVCHLAILPFVIGVIYQFYKLAIKFIKKKYIPFAFLVLLVEPTFSTQTLLAGYDIVFCFLFLAGLNSIFGNNRKLLALSMLSMPVLSSRGFSLVASLFIVDLYINHSEYINMKKFIKSTLVYLPAFLLFITWLICHYRITGWFAVSGNREKLHHLNGLGGMLRNFIYILWKIIDFGRVMLFLFIFLLFFISLKTKDTKGANLFFILIFSVLPYILFFLPFSYPVSHRYFMITYLTGILTFVYFVGSLKLKMIRVIILTLTVISLLAGNFWIYPERFGNGWDSSLKVMPYFKLKEKFDSYIKTSKINQGEIGANFPMNFDNYDTRLSGEHFQFTDIDKKPFNKFRYIVQSNICNTFTPEEIDNLKTRWILDKEFYSCRVYIKLYKNPDLY
jgi:hypothetical protein